MTVQVAMAAAMLVFMKIWLALTMSASVLMATVLQPLKPNQQNQRMKTPRAAAVRLWPGMARALPSFPYFPIRGPSILAPMQAVTPPTICTAVLPAKS